MEDAPPKDEKKQEQPAPAEALNRLGSPEKKPSGLFASMFEGIGKIGNYVKQRFNEMEEEAKPV